MNDFSTRGEWTSLVPFSDRFSFAIPSERYRALDHRGCAKRVLKGGDFRKLHQGCSGFSWSMSWRTRLFGEYEGTARIRGGR